MTRVILLLFSGSLALFGCSNQKQGTDASEEESIEISESNGTTPDKLEPDQFGWIYKSYKDDTLTFIKKVWPDYCSNPQGNLLFTFKGELTLFSYCEPSNDNEWFQYLLLEHQGGVEEAYRPIILNKRSSIPDEANLPAFPEFTPTIIKAIDANRDGDMDIAIEIQVTGKSIGSGAEENIPEEDKYYNFSFYEVYETIDEGMIFSQNLTEEYSKQQEILGSSATLMSQETSETQQILEVATGEYKQAIIIDGDIYWNKCQGVSLGIGKYDNKDTYSLWMDNIMDGFEIIVNEVVINEANGNNLLFSSGNGRGMDIEMATANEANILRWEDNIYILEKHKDKFPESPEECDEEGGG